MTTQQLTPHEAYIWLARIMPNCRNKQMEQVLAQDPFLAYLYAKNVINGRFEAAEPEILKSPCYAYMYAKNVLKQRWLEAEPIMTKNPQYLYYYWQKYCQHFNIDPDQ